MCTDFLGQPFASCTRQRAGGFSLLEVLIAIVVLGVGIAGLAGVFAFVTRDSADPMLRKQALAIAEGLMQEIQLKSFANPSGGYSGTDRAQFDDVKDYHGYATTGVMSADNTTVLGLEKYNVSVSVTDSAYGSATLTVGAGNAVLITVTIAYPGGSIALSGYRTGYASDA